MLARQIYTIMHYFDITVLFETLICLSQFTIHTCYSKICGYVLFMLGSNPEFLPEANDKIRNVVIAETPTTG
jgi:hypothetical protein